jgi:hypothetical protein
VTISLDELKAILEKQHTPPKELGVLWTTEQIVDATGIVRKTVSQSLLKNKVRRWKKNKGTSEPWLYCAADVIKLAKEGKL